MAKEIFLYTTIYNWTAESIISQIEDNMGSPIAIRCNCVGGDVKAGYGIAAKIMEHGDVTLKIDGSADSMMFIIAMFAKKVECLNVSTFVMHRAAFASWFNPSEDDIKSLKQMNDQLKKIALKKFDQDNFKAITGYTIDEVFDSEPRIDVEIDAKKAKKLGLVQEIKTLSPSEIAAFNNLLQITAESIDKNNNVNKNTVMNKDEIKLKFPDVYQAIVQEGIEKGINAERDRVEAYMVFNDVDPAAVKEGISKGTALGAKEMAEFSRKQISAVQLENIKTDSPEGVITPQAENKKPQTEADKAKAEFEASLKSNLNLVA